MHTALLPYRCTRPPTSGDTLLQESSRVARTWGVAGKDGESLASQAHADAERMQCIATYQRREGRGTSGDPCSARCKRGKKAREECKLVTRGHAGAVGCSFCHAEGDEVMKWRVRSACLPACFSYGLQPRRRAPSPAQRAYGARAAAGAAGACAPPQASGHRGDEPKTASGGRLFRSRRGCVQGCGSRSAALLHRCRVAAQPGLHLGPPAQQAQRGHAQLHRRHLRWRLPGSACVRQQGKVQQNIRISISAGTCEQPPAPPHQACHDSGQHTCDNPKKQRRATGRLTSLATTRRDSRPGLCCMRARASARVHSRAVDTKLFTGLPSARSTALQAGGGGGRGIAR